MTVPSTGPSLRILALGNDILGDDAFAFLVAQRVRERIPGVEVTCSSASGFHLLDDLLHRRLYRGRRMLLRCGRNQKTNQNQDTCTNAAENSWGHGVSWGWRTRGESVGRRFSLGDDNSPYSLNQVWALRVIIQSRYRPAIGAWTAMPRLEGRAEIP